MSRRPRRRRSRRRRRCRLVGVLLDFRHLARRRRQSEATRAGRPTRVRAAFQKAYLQQLSPVCRNHWFYKFVGSRYEVRLKARAFCTDYKSKFSCASHVFNFTMPLIIRAILANKNYIFPISHKKLYRALENSLQIFCNF